MSPDETSPRWLLGAYWDKRRLRADDCVAVAIATMDAIQSAHPAVDAWYAADDGPVPRHPPLELTEGRLTPGRRSGFDVKIHAWNGDIEAPVLYSAMTSDYGSARVPGLVKIEMPGPRGRGWDDAAVTGLLLEVVHLTPADFAVLDSGATDVEPTQRRAMVGWRTYVRDTPGDIGGLPGATSSRAFAEGCLISFEQPASQPIDPGAAQAIANRLDEIWTRDAQS